MTLSWIVVVYVHECSYYVIVMYHNYIIIMHIVLTHSTWCVLHTATFSTLTPSWLVLASPLCHCPLCPWRGPSGWNSEVRYYILLSKHSSPPYPYHLHNSWVPLFCVVLVTSQLTVILDSPFALKHSTVNSKVQRLTHCSLLAFLEGLSRESTLLATAQKQG